MARAFIKLYIYYKTEKIGNVHCQFTLRHKLRIKDKLAFSHPNSQSGNFHSYKIAELLSTKGTQAEPHILVVTWLSVCSWPNTLKNKRVAQLAYRANFRPLTIQNKLQLFNQHYPDNLK